MVLPASAADPGAAEARAWLDKLIQPLELSRGGILLCLRDATPTQLGPVVRALSGAPPWGDDEPGLEVCLRAPDVLDVAPGSRVLLRVRVEDLDWLNIARPLFAERELRTILWADAQAFDGLIRRAVDFFDWVSRVVVVPGKAVPDVAVEQMRSALSAGAEIAWTGPGLAETLDAAGGGETLELHVEEPFLGLVAALRKGGLPTIAGVESERDVWRIRMALALAEREGSWVALDPAVAIEGVRPRHAQQSDWDQASELLEAAGWRRPALVAAWLDLDPDRIAAALDHVGRERPPGDPPRVGRSDNSKAGKLLLAVRDLQGGSPSSELINQAENAGFPEVAMSLSLAAWKLAVDKRADRLVGWLADEGEVETALEVLQVWKAWASGDPRLRGPANAWLRVIRSIAPRAQRAPEIAKNEPSDDELVERWRSGERSAGDSLITRYYHLLNQYFRTRVNEDLVPYLIQETIARLVQSAVVSTTTSLRGHLFRVAREVVGEHSIVTGKSASHVSSTAPESPIVLHDSVGLTVSELATTFGVPPAVIRARLARARLADHSAQAQARLNAKQPRGS